MTTDSTESQMALALFEEQPEIMRKPVQAIHMAITGGQQNKTQRLAFNAMLKHALEEHAKDPTLNTDTYAMSRVQLMRTIGYTSPNRKHLKDTLTEMQNFKVQWDFLKQDGDATWVSCVLLPFISFDRDKIYYSYASQIKPMLFNSKVYARLDLSIQRKFRLDCAAALYEWVIRFRTNPSHVTNKMSWEDWRWVIYGEVHETSVLTEYKMFKREKLKPAIKEINDKSDITIELVEDKDGGRGVRYLQFVVNEKPTTAIDAEEDTTQLWDKKLEEFGVGPRDRKKILDKYTVQAIEANFEYTQNRVRDPKQVSLKNVVAYFKRALEGNYAGDASHKKPEIAASPIEGMAAIQTKFTKSRNDDAAAMFAEMGEDDRESLVAEYNAAQTNAEAVIPHAGEKRLNRHLIPFYGWLASKTWGEPTAQDLLEFALKTGAVKLNA